MLLLVSLIGSSYRERPDFEKALEAHRAAKRTVLERGFEV